MYLNVTPSSFSSRATLSGGCAQKLGKVEHK
jgi:hypothetical protein